MKHIKLVTCYILIGILCSCAFEMKTEETKMELYKNQYDNTNDVKGVVYDMNEGSYLIGEGGILPGKYYSTDVIQGSTSTIKDAKNQMIRPGINEFSKYETTIYDINTHEIVEVINIKKIFEEHFGDSKEEYQLMGQSTMGLTVKNGYDCVVLLVSTVPTQKELQSDEEDVKVIKNYPMYTGIQSDYVYWNKEDVMRFPKATSVYKKELGYLQVTNIMGINGWNEILERPYFGYNPYWQGTKYENMARITVNFSSLREKGEALLLFERFPGLKDKVFNSDLNGNINLYIDTTNWEELMLLFFPLNYKINYVGLCVSEYNSKSGELEPVSDMEMVLDRMRWVDDFFEEDSK